MALADGMGERPNGGLASALALRELEACVAAYDLTAARVHGFDGFAAAEWINGAFRAARQALVAARATVAADTPMETSLMIGVIAQRQVIIGHAGHSRCYRWRSGDLQQLTTDHRRHPRGLDELAEDERRLLRSLVCVPMRGVGEGDAPEITTAPIEQGDFLLFCSNGVSDVLPAPTLARHFGPGMAARSVAGEILEAAEIASADDDVTAIVVRIGALALDTGSRTTGFGLECNGR